MLTGTGKLYWRIDPLPGNKKLAYGGILVESSSPADKKGCVITVTDPMQDEKLVLEGVDLKVPHDGTPVEFTAGKVPNHEIFYATRIGFLAPPGGPSTPGKVDVAAMTGSTLEGVSDRESHAAVLVETWMAGTVVLKNDELESGSIRPKEGDTKKRIAFDYDVVSPDGAHKFFIENVSLVTYQLKDSREASKVKPA